MTQEAMTSETQRQYVSGETATRDSVEDALDRAFAAVGVGKVAALNRLNPVKLSPLMQRIVDVLRADGGWVKAREIAQIVGSKKEGVQAAVHQQRARLVGHGLRIESNKRRGYRISEDLA